ncbi:carbon monoxide dehydrogenase subunit G [Acidobacteriia bacterium AH_259_A11_L15]|nr:carbon monoxide dehydrogenase subunit G [Acidobacteriia bacterium AH_259_A11_L15]
MKIQGTQTVNASRERVFGAVVDPTVIAKLLPGCEKLEPTGEDTYQVKMKLGLGAVSGSYQGTVRVSEKQPPERLRLTVKSRGPWGFAEGDGTLTLTEEGGGTTIEYAGELKVGGMIASVGQRLLDAAAKMVIGQFFKNLEKEAGGS